MTVLVIVDNDAALIGELYQKSRGSLVDSVRYAVECGQRLAAKKGSLPHGQWLPWLEANEAVLGFSSRTTASRLMSLGSNDALAHHLDEPTAVAVSRQLWGHMPPTIADQTAAYAQEITEGCTSDDLDALANSGKKFSVIYADPPWSFHVYSGKGKQRSADRHYNTQSLEDIMALPIDKLAADDCALLMWAVMPELPGALEVIKAWGFTYKTAGFTWIKQNKSGNGLFWGMGYWTRANAEVCLLATRGSPKRQAKDVHQVVMSPVSEHSRKPDEVQLRIERLLPGPYLELYGRRAVPGWTVWGNQISRNLFQQDIPEFAA